MLEDFIFVMHIAVKSSVAVFLATLGEIVAERSGVLNLGVEGMMLMGALVGFAVGLYTGNPWLAASASILAGGLMALVHALFAIGFKANQVLSGLALTLLGTGLSNFLGRPLIGKSGLRLSSWNIPGLSDIPVLGDIFFRQSGFAYAAYLLAPLLWYLLYRTRLGLRIRACGQDAKAADAGGVAVARIRTGCTVFGGMLAGLAGACLSLAYTPGWKERMTAGQGWIAIALVIFATWNPLWAIFGALLYGGLTALQFYFQATGVDFIPAAFLRMFPYLLTIAVLALVSRFEGLRRKAGAPSDLGVPFSRE